MSLAMGDLRGYMKRIDLTEARAKQRVTEVYRNIIKEIFVDIVKHTPQFTGNLASGWQISFGLYGVNPTSYLSDEQRQASFNAYRSGKFDAFERGDNPAVANTINRELEKLKDIRYNSIVKIVNPVEYADDVDAGLGPRDRNIRKENLYYGKVFMASYAQVKYGKLKNLVRIAK